MYLHIKIAVCWMGLGSVLKWGQIWMKILFEMNYLLSSQTTPRWKNRNKNTRNKNNFFINGLLLDDGGEYEN